jgi:UDP-N-acetylglucosamine 1-carboxyvinyltransferase
MDKLIVEGGRPLEGRIPISGSKNAALPILIAAILAEGETILTNVPQLADIRTTIKLLSILGCETDVEGDTVRVVNCALKSEAPYELVKTMRASILCLGPLLARLGEARVSLPGGCAIGARPVDLHLKGLEKLGASFELDKGYVTGRCDRLRGAEITLDFPTVGGTEHLVMSACLAEGESVIENAAREPEVVDLAEFLIACGAKIEGHGTSVIRIQGVESLQGTNYRVMSDRIEAGTYLAAAPMTRGVIELAGCPVEAMDATITKFEEMGVRIERRGDSLLVDGSGDIRCTDVSTQPYPGFPTDMQAQIMAAMTVAAGAGAVEETIFENRFMHVQELVRMGADIKLKGRIAMVRGVPKLVGAPVMASDLRASASLVLAGLAAEGATEVQRIYHLDRGYESIEAKLGDVGAAIRRVRE